MPTYVVLGATGATGSEIVKCLLPRADIQLRVYARNAQRLESKLPALSDAKNAKIFVGSISDAELMKECFRDADVIFQTVAQNNEEPVVTVARDTAKAIVKGLEALKAEEEEEEEGRAQEGGARRKWKCPRLIVLSSESLHEEWSKSVPQPARHILHSALKNIYNDVEDASKYLQTFDWIPLVLAMPGGLIQLEAQGVEIVVHTRGSEMISYPDLGKGMVMMAEAGDEVVGERVGLKSLGIQGGFTYIWPNIYGYILPGLLCNYVRPLWWAGKKINLW